MQTTQDKINYLEEAIIKSIEGGWRNKETHQGVLISRPQSYVQFWNSSTCDDMYPVEGTPLSSILLDPLFWQCLGKSLGWDNKDEFILNDENRWIYRWHSLIDHIADGGDIDTFFKELLANKSE